MQSFGPVRAPERPGEEAALAFLDLKHGRSHKVEAEFLAVELVLQIEERLIEMYQRGCRPCAYRTNNYQMCHLSAHCIRLWEH